MGTFHCYSSLPEGFSWWSLSEPWVSVGYPYGKLSGFSGTKTQVEQLRAEGNKRGEVSGWMGWDGISRRYFVWGKFVSSQNYYVNRL